MTSKEALDYMYGVAICGSGLGETADKVRECYNKIADDLEVLDYYEKIKLMLKQKECVLRYIESEDCFVVRCILDDKWYKLTDDLIKNNIKEEIEPLPLIDKIKKQKKILEILTEWCLNDFIEYNYNDYGWVEFPLTIYDTDTEEEANKKRIVIDYLKKCK